MGTFSIERVFPTMPEVLKDVLHTKSYSSINLLLVVVGLGRDRQKGRHCCFVGFVCAVSALT